MNERDLKKVDRMVEESESSLRRLIQLVEESNVESLEITSGDKNIKITKRLGSANGRESDSAVMQPVAASAPPQPPSQLQSPPHPTEPPPESETEDTGKLLAIKSPMVGTFYSAPSPDADPYVAVNQKITVGQVVCIVEAMKLMNEIESEVSGRVAKILVRNGEPVEFGQTMFLIEPE